MTFDYDFFIVLVYFGVNDFVLNRVDCPILNVVFFNVQELSQLAVFEIGLFCIQSANLDIRLLVDKLFFSESFLFHKFIELTKLRFKAFSIC